MTRIRVHPPRSSATCEGTRQSWKIFSSAFRPIQVRDATEKRVAAVWHWCKRFMQPAEKANASRSRAEFVSATTRQDGRERIRHPASEDKVCTRDLSLPPDRETGLPEDRGTSALQANLVSAGFREFPECIRESGEKDRIAPHWHPLFAEPGLVDRMKYHSNAASRRQGARPPSSSTPPSGPINRPQNGCARRRDRRQ